MERPASVRQCRGSPRGSVAGGRRIPSAAAAVSTSHRRWCARGGGLSIGTIIFLVVIYFIFKMMGIDLLQVLDGGTTSGPGYEQSQFGGPARRPMTR